MSAPARAWKRVIGIVGGLGPHAHLALERAILDEVAAAADQDYPEWILTSMPQTPDRTEAILHGGDSPVPTLIEAIRRLSATAHFAIVPCVTAHHFLPEVRRQVAFPMLDIVEEALRAARDSGASRVGVLATTGTLESGLFERTAERLAPGLEVISPLDLEPDGGSLQERLVMGPIYDPERRYGAALKTGGAESESDRERLAAPLREAARKLVRQGAAAIIMGCTEIPLALREGAVDDKPLIDPLRAGARAAVRIARGERDLPA